LRQTLDLAFRNAHAYRRSAKQARHLYRQQVHAMLHTLAPREEIGEPWEGFLTFRVKGDSSVLLNEAKGTADVFDAHHHRQVMARASLLLRLATGACEERVKSLSNETREKLEFWWLPVGEDRGLWDHGGQPASFSELWTEIEESFRDLNQWQDQLQAGNMTCGKLWREQSRAASILSSCERIAFWGLGL
jgi:hypothetical protein